MFGPQNTCRQTLAKCCAFGEVRRENLVQPVIQIAERGDVDAGDLGDGLRVRDGLEAGVERTAVARDVREQVMSRVGRE